MSIANELITRGWLQGGWESDDGSVCYVEAAMKANGINSETTLVPSRLLMALCKGARVTGSGEVRTVISRLATWNDSRHRSFDEVLRAAKEADEILDA